MNSKLSIFKNLFVLIFALNISYNSYGADVFEINAKKIQYLEDSNLIIAEGKAVAKNSEGKKLFADKITYYKKKNIIQSIGNSKYLNDSYELSADTFVYNIQNKTIEAKGNVVLVDFDQNKFEFSYLKYLENTDEIYGENAKSNLNDGSNIFSKKINLNNKKEKMTLTSSKYTTCNLTINQNGVYCPSWHLKSKKTIHDKKKKRIIHKNSFLKIKNIPVLYTPYFSHPDPSVKRQSGFLPPAIKTLSSIGRTMKIPYFWAVSEDKDLTITPIYYFDEKSAILSSYRQDFKSGFLNIETGYSGGYKRLNVDGRTNGSRNYFFLNYDGQANNLVFKNSNINFKIQKISQQNFVRVNKINTKLFKEDIRSLENVISLDSFGERKRLNLKAGIFENLDKQNYTYLFPDGVFSFNTQKFDSLRINFNSYFQGAKYSDAQKTFKIRNLINASSKQFINNVIGSSTVLRTNLFNKNEYNKNLVGSKEGDNIDNYLTVALDNALPFAKFSNNSYQSFTPRIFAKFTTGKQQKIEDENKILDYYDAYSLNRNNNLDLIDTGFTVGHGLEYKIKAKTNEKKFGVSASTGISQIIRNDREENMSNSSSLKNKSSDFAGFLNFNLSGDKINNDIIEKKKIGILDQFSENNISLKYKYNISNDFKEINRNNLIFSSTYKNIYSSIIFDEKNKYIGSERSLKFEAKTLFDQNYYMGLTSKRNLVKNKPEYYSLSFNYENDCILTSLAFMREFYSDQDVKSAKSLFFNITLKPFSDNISPDLTNFLN